MYLYLDSVPRSFFDHSIFEVSSGPGDSNPHSTAGEEKRDPWWDEFIGSVGQIGQLIMLLSGRQAGEKGREKELRYRRGVAQSTIKDPKRMKKGTEGVRVRKRERVLCKSVHAAVFLCALYANPGLPYSISLPSWTVNTKITCLGVYRCSCHFTPLLPHFCSVPHIQATKSITILLKE